ncbi:MAG: UDP-N-acetylmuramoyl-tripeptide--D-alanyl-D-alanine ligase [Acidobacteriota bacterium]
MSVLEIREIAATVEGTLISGDASARIGRFKIDSREVEDGDLFFCLRGPNQDGHDYLQDAIDHGATAAIVSRAPNEEFKKRLRIIRVADTREALQKLAHHVRVKEGFKVVGITGSMGKTTTKEMIFHALSPSFRTMRSRGNLNNLYGLPLSLLEMDERCEVAVLEMGVSYPGELKKLTDIADPEIGVLTSIKAVHLEHFHSIEEIARAKAELFEGMRHGSVAIYNKDDERVRAIAMRFPGERLSYGLMPGSDIHAVSIHGSIREGVTFDAQCRGERFQTHLSLFGLHNVYNALAALSVCASLEADLGKASEALSAFKPCDRRGVITRLKKEITIIDDTYNSNPAAMEMVLESIARERVDGRKVVVFGDMLELGSDAPMLHAAIGEKIAEAGVELLVGVGELSAFTLGAAASRGLKACRHFPDSKQASDAVAGLVLEGDLILVKGSRGMKMEVVIEKLKQELEEGI